jgi:release factor glutamine methyltransferase
MPELAVTLRALLSDGAAQLKRAGVSEPRRQALRLWSALAGITPGQTLLDSDQIVDDCRAEGFRHATDRLSRGEPIAHVTGRAGFRHLGLRSDARALIPRPETEGLVDLLLQRVKHGAVADIGTGCGCLALSLALEGNFSRVVGVDCSGAAIALARANAELTGTPGTVEFVRADLCTPLRAGCFDALVSNPPYLTQREYAELDRSVREWEPSLALCSGADGMAATAGLLDQAPVVLRSGGWLAIEVDCTRADKAARLAAARGWQDVSIHKDLFGRERYLLARRSETR